MPRYYFHIREGRVWVPDEEGSELSNLEAALEEARGHAREMLAETIRAGKKVDARRFEIADGRGAVVATLDFADLLK